MSVLTDVMIECWMTRHSLSTPRPLSPSSFAKGTFTLLAAQTNLHRSSVLVVVFCSHSLTQDQALRISFRSPSIKAFILGHACLAACLPHNTSRVGGRRHLVHENLLTSIPLQLSSLLFSMLKVTMTRLLDEVSKLSRTELPILSSGCTRHFGTSARLSLHSLSSSLTVIG